MRRRFETLADEAVGYVAEVLPRALAKYPQVVLATHVPPFREAAWYRDRYCSEDWLPYFSCRAMGELLVGLMETRRDARLLVLCGHTHGSGKAEILENLLVITGGAESGRPAPQQVLEFDGPAVPGEGGSW